MKPLLILSLLSLCAGCDAPMHAHRLNTYVRDIEGKPASKYATHTWASLELWTGDTLQMLQPSEFENVIKAMRLLAAHADPSPQVGSVNAVLLPRSQELLIEAKRQEAREAEYAWAKSVLEELEKRK